MVYWALPFPILLTPGISSGFPDNFGKGLVPEDSLAIAGNPHWFLWWSTGGCDDSFLGVEKVSLQGPEGFSGLRVYKKPLCMGVCKMLVKDHFSILRTEKNP
jgi:hypothetical protein